MQRFFTKTKVVSNYLLQYNAVSIINFDKLSHEMLKSRRLVVFLVQLFFGYFQKLSCVTSYQNALVLFAVLWDSIISYFTRLCFKNPFLCLSLCLCVAARSVVNTQQAVWFCVFLVWRHQLLKVNKSSSAHVQMFFSKISLFLMFLNIQIWLY